jgi:hypothetical protein
MRKSEQTVRFSREEQAHDLQIRFLKLVARAEPRVVEQLAKVAGRARILAPTDSPGERLVATMKSGHLDTPLLPDARTSRLLNGWAKRWHLDAEWAFRLAWLSILRARESGDDIEFWGSALPKSAVYSEPLVLVPFAVVPYDPVAEPYAAALVRFEKAATREIRNYLKARANESTIPGYPGSKNLTRDLWWTALYQCAGKSFNQIKTDPQFPAADVRTVAAAVKLTLRRLDLPIRRPTKSGPRKKTPAKKID